MTKTQMIECALKSIWGAILIREPKLVNLAVLMVALPERIARSEEGFNEFLTVYGSRLINAAAKVRSPLG
jgi:hypothetical protein